MLRVTSGFYHPLEPGGGDSGGSSDGAIAEDEVALLAGKHGCPPRALRPLRTSPSYGWGRGRLQQCQLVEPTGDGSILLGGRAVAS
jgi:hypothetical protein